MSVAVFPLGPLETNCYLVSYEGQAVAIDVGRRPRSREQISQRARVRAESNLHHAYAL